jgi:hypothetical protein
VKWSRTHRCWYLPYSTESWQQIKAIFPDIQAIKQKSEMEPLRDGATHPRPDIDSPEVIDSPTDISTIEVEHMPKPKADPPISKLQGVMGK